jgi:hypothetical protein
MTSRRLLIQPESTLSNSRQAPPKQPIKRSGTSRFRLVSLVLFCGGIAIMIVFAVLSQISVTVSLQPMVSPVTYSDDLLFFVSAIAGALLAFLGGVRMSLILRPRNLLVWSCVFLAASASGPLVTAALPSLQSVSSTRTCLLPFLIFRILAFIFGTTALFRWKVTGTNCE